MRQFVELTYSVRLPVLCRYFGQYCFVLAALTVPPVVVAAMTASWLVAACYGIVVIGCVLLGALLSRFDAPSNVQRNEAMTLVVGSFLFTSLVMTFPFVIEGLSVSDAWFESVSAVTTTGLSTVTNLNERSLSLLFTRAWMQWYGGLGIVVFSVALLVHPGVTARRLTLAGVAPESLVGNTRIHARRALLIYGALTVVAFVVLLIACRNLFDAVTYTLAAVSTGGFAPHDDSLAALQGGWTAQMLTILVCFAGAIPLVLYERAFRENWREVLKATQLQALMLFGLGSTIAVFLCLWSLQGMSASEAARQSPLLSLSAQSTAGFAPSEVQTLQGATKLVLIFAMLTGGGLGSSAGGIKIWRVLVSWQLLRLLLTRTGATACSDGAEVGRASTRKRRDHGGRFDRGAVLAVIFFSWIPFVAAGYDPLDALFEVVSATGTVGLSTGITSDQLPLLLKFFLGFDMLLGASRSLHFLSSSIHAAGLAIDRSRNESGVRRYKRIDASYVPAPC